MGGHVELVAENGDGTLNVRHGAHAGSIPVALARLPGGAADRSGLILTCPVCGASSYWPVSGGAEPEKADDLEAIAEAAPAAALAAPPPPKAKKA